METECYLSFRVIFDSEGRVEIQSKKSEGSPRATRRAGEDSKEFRLKTNK